MKLHKEKKRTFAPFVTERVNERGEVIEKVEIDLADDLRIGRDLRRALKTSMSTLGWYMQLKEQAHAMMKHWRYLAHRREESAYYEIRVDNPKLSETAVKNRVHLDKRWLKRIKKYMLWRNRYRMLSEVCVALKERNDNLRTLESSERKERDAHYE